MDKGELIFTTGGGALGGATHFLIRILKKIFTAMFGERERVEPRCIL
jgi:hypothetical protein